MIQLNNVWFRYSSEWVLRGVSLGISRGVTVILGPNGAGKTTLLKVMGLLLKPLRGEVIVEGVNPWSVGGLLEARRKVVYVHEKPVLVRGSVLDNIMLGLRIRGVGSVEASTIAMRIARMLGLDGVVESNARSLSAGQAQLVSIARAIAVKPRAILLDEPFAHLDRNKRILVSKVLESLAFNQGTSIAIATHDTLLAAKIADKAYYMEDGTVSIMDKDSLYELV
ncbi:MAG: ATP-binding cassette domain-containing protein [Desulfurococcales archaeon]|nr:ATP-binding cassette domain-containing protein [Desulfurococcales archaeon]